MWLLFLQGGRRISCCHYILLNSVKIKTIKSPWNCLIHIFQLDYIVFTHSCPSPTCIRRLVLEYFFRIFIVFYDVKLSLIHSSTAADLKKSRILPPHLEDSNVPIVCCGVMLSDLVQVKSCAFEGFACCENAQLRMGCHLRNKNLLSCFMLVVLVPTL